MKILTFDIEDWFHCDFISEPNTWTKYETRIHKSTDKILDLLDKKGRIGTFFILGWIAEKYPEVVKSIHNNGHEIACHSFYHNLVHSMAPNAFLKDTERGIKVLEDVIGEKISIYRAPGFSVNEKTPWAFEILSSLGIETDCSVFPSKHDYGGFPNFGESKPALIKYNGIEMKEFPMNTRKLLNHQIVFSGGGFFRLFPYSLIKKWTKAAPYLMSYFHPRDFDYGQPMLPQLPMMRKFKSYYGLKGAFRKFDNWINDFETVSLMEAEKNVNWKEAKVISL